MCAEQMVINTYVPKNFVGIDGKDYTQFGGLKDIVDRDSFDAAKALEYKEQAVAELKPLLEAAGYSFPSSRLTVSSDTMPSGLDT